MAEYVEISTYGSLLDVPEEKLPLLTSSQIQVLIDRGHQKTIKQVENPWIKINKERKELLAKKKVLIGKILKFTDKINEKSLFESDNVELIGLYIMLHAVNQALQDCQG